MSTKFRYRASTDRGELVEGVSESVSRDELLEELRGRDLYALSVEEVGAPPRGDRLRGRDAAVTRWARSFATMAGAGTPLDRALDVSARQAGHEGMRAVVLSVRDAVRAGASLSEALARHPRWFPDVVPAMARAGEASGAMGEVFEEVADYLEEVAELRAQVRSAMIYPALMASVAALGVAVLLLFVVPRFADILADLGGSMPLTTRMLIASGTFLGRFWWLVLGVLAAAVGAGSVWVRRPGNRERWHRARLAMPKLGDLELQLLSARFARVLGLLLSYGLPLLPALRIARGTVGNLHVRSGIDRAIDGIAEGHSVAGSVTGVLPSVAVELLAVGEETGRLGAMCTRVAESYDKEVRRSVKVAVSLLEPVMIVTFGALVGLVALAMLQAIYSVNTNLG